MFTLNRDGSEFRLLYTFGTNVTQGHSPWSRLLVASDGALYGTTDGGGNGQRGTVYRLDPRNGRYSVLHNFSNLRGGRMPRAGLIEGPDGLLYGATPAGGKDDGGTLFRLARDGSQYAELYQFSIKRPDGMEPQGVILGGDGMLYGTTAAHGANQGGTLFSLKPDGSGFRVLYAFSPTGVSGAQPHGALVWAVDGGLYGMTRAREHQSAAILFKRSLRPSP